MTRWKHNSETLILMHAHNQWSRWNGYKLMAAQELGIPVCERSYRNCSGDGSWDTEWLVPAGCASRINVLATSRYLAD